MAFAADRDVLALEPNVFRDVVFDAQRRLTLTDGVVAGSVLSSLSVDFEEAGVGAGSVVLVSDHAYEVVERLSATSLSLSRLRDDRGGAVIPVPSGTGQSVRVHTFAPQIDDAHGRVVRGLGITNESAVIDVDAGLIRLEAMGALQAVFAAAANEAAAHDPLWSRALHYGDRFNRELRRLSVGLDTNGDGSVDAAARAQPARLVRE